MGLLGFGAAFWLTRQPDRAAMEVARQPFDPAILVRPNSPVLGPADAPAILVEFFDPASKGCRDFYPVVEALRREFPIQLCVLLRYVAIHEVSDEAVRILEAARAHRIFEPVLNALLERQSDWALHGGSSLDRAWDIAGLPGLDVEAGQAYRQSPGLVALLNQDAIDLKAVGIRQTPTFFVHGQRVPRFGAEELMAAVRAEVERNGG